MKNLSRGILVLLVCIVISCSKQEKLPEVSAVPEIDKRHEADLQAKAIIGKSIPLRNVVGDSINFAGKTLLLFTGYDCGSCVSAAFGIVNHLDSLSTGSCVVVDCQSAKGNEQLYNQNYIFTDRQDIIRRALKYVRTPVLLHFDKAQKIASVYFPETGDKPSPEIIKILQ